MQREGVRAKRGEMKLAVGGSVIFVSRDELGNGWMCFVSFLDEYGYADTSAMYIGRTASCIMHHPKPRMSQRYVLHQYS